MLFPCILSVSTEPYSLLYKDSKISFDLVVETMYETGKDLGSHYRETSKGGLAKKYCRNKFYNDNLEEE